MRFVTNQREVDYMVLPRWVVALSWDWWVSSQIWWSS